VPTLVLQPLVENAIRHGIEPAEKGGVVRVSASRKVGKLVLVVEDNGVGLANSNADSDGPENPAGLYSSLPAPARSSTTSVVLARAGTGIGLANLRERLQALYGARQRLELTPRATGGVVVRIELPWQPTAPSETNDSFEA
jgi:sensor histidine kinase YesM